MAVDLELAPKQKRPPGEPCCEPVVYPDVEREQAERMAAVAKALGDPIRLQLVDVLRKHAGKVCVCELVPLFDISQPTLSHHLKKLREAGIVDSERRGLWAYYYVNPTSTGGSAQMAEVTEIREAVRTRYAAAAAMRERGRRRDAAHPAAAARPPGTRGVRRRALRTEDATTCPKPRASPRSAAGTHRGRRPPRGRDGARPRLGRRHRRAALGQARRPERHGHRPRHDRRDARARAAQRGRGRRRERRVRSRARSRTSRSPTPRSTS